MPIEKSRQLQRNLYLAAKKDKQRRFHALYDRIFRLDILWRAWKEVRENKGSAGIDGITFEMIEEYGVEEYLLDIQEDLKNKKYRPKKWPDAIAKTFYSELERLDMYNPNSPDYSVQLNYLQQLVKLPWGEYTEDNLSLSRAQKILDQDHYGMEKVKERILEYLSVLKLRGDLKSPIICLYGPPGVGKTSLGKSIAEAMKRKYTSAALRFTRATT